MNGRDKVLLAASLAVLKERVKQADHDIRQQLATDMQTGDRLTAFFTGQLLGAVTMTKGRVTPRVSDPDTFAAWVADHYPTEVEHKPVVRDSFKAAVLEASRQAGEPCTPDGTTDVHGIVVAEGDPYLSVRLTPEADEIVTRMVADGYLTPAGELTQIEATGDG